MSDPLGFINQTGSAGNIGKPPAGGVKPKHDGPSFADALKQELNEVNRLQQEARVAIEDLQAGRRNDIEGVMLATQKADTAFRMLVSVRNKVHQAYDEIKQMRV